MPIKKYPRGIYWLFNYLYPNKLIVNNQNYKQISSMKTTKNLILVILLSTLFITAKFVKAEEVSAEDEDTSTEDMLDQLEDLSEMDHNTVVEHTKSIEKEMTTRLSDTSKMYTHDEVLPIAYSVLIFEELDQINAIKEAHQKNGKLDDMEASMISNAVVCDAYIKTCFKDSNELNHEAVLSCLSHKAYDTWMDDLPDSVIDLLNVYMPDDEDTSADL